MKSHVRYLFTLLTLLLLGIGGVKADEIVFDFDCSDGSALADKGLSSSPTNATVTQEISGTKYTWKATGTTNQPGSGTFSVAKNQNGLQLGSSKKPLGNYTLTLQTQLENVTKIVVKAFGGLSGNTLVAGVGATNFGDAISLGQTANEGIYTFESSVGQTGNVVLSGNDKNSYIRIQTITITYGNGGTSTLTPAGLTFGETTSFTVNLGETFTAPTLTNPHNLPVSYSSSELGVATVHETSGTVTLVGAGTTTITASSAETNTYAAGSASYTLTVVDPDAPGTQNNPYTVAQALAANAVKDVYVKGIVSKIDELSTQYGNATYYISDDRETETEIKVYRGKYLNNESFTAVDQLQVKDNVVIFGEIKPYNNVNQLAQGNYLISLGRKEKVDAGLEWSAEEASAVRGETFVAPSLTNPNNVVVSYKSSNTKVATISEAGTITLLKAGETTITATFAGDDDYNAAEVSYTLTVTVPSHTATFFVNGQQQGEPVTVAEDETITFPTVVEELYGKKFVGWTTEAIDGETIDGTTNVKPEVLVTSATMGNADVTYYAVYAVREGEGVSSVTTLTNANIVAAGNGKDGYNDWTIIDSNDRKWNAHAIKNQHSNATSGYHYLQIKKSTDSEQFYIQVPEMGGTITAMTMTVSGSSKPMTDGNNSSTLFFSNSNLTSATGNGVVSGEGASTVTLDCSSLGLSTGYITSSGAVRIWDVEVTYGTPASYSDYCTTVVAPVKPAKPIVFHDGGEGVTYEGELTVPMFAEEGATIYYTTDGSEPDVQNAEQAYSGPVSLPVGETTVKAIAVKNGMASDVVEKVYTIDPVQAPDIVDLDGYYSIQNYKGNYVNVAGRKTVTFVEDNSDKAGTVIKVKTTNGEVDVLRSQGVDVPGYAERAMNYVDDIISLAVEKLELQNLLGSTGEQTILEKFHDAFDYHLHLEQPAENKYRIYGKTPSMKHVVDFYAENKDKVDAKLPMMEERINYAINKVLEKVGRGLSLKDQFNIHRIWEDMNVEGLTEPVEGDDAAIARFYEEVLSSEAKVWLFAYEAAMYYVNFVEGKESFLELKAQYPEYFKYWDMAKRVRPDFKYYIVSNTEGNGIDFISEGNEDIINNAERTIWTLGQREKFKVSLGVSTTKTVYPVSQDGTVESYTEYYTTLNTDFAYTLPEDVTAYQITGVGEVKDNETMGTVLKKAITGTIPAQTPVLLMAKENTAELPLAADANALSGNELYGNEYLIEKDQLKHTMMKTVFETIKENFGDELYNRYVAEYEHLMLLNSGTVNNKYFFNLSKANDLAASDSYNAGKVMVLGQDDDLGIRFHFASKEDLIGNEAFMFDDTNKLEDIVLTLKGDINRDGTVSIADVTALVNIILGKAKYPDDADKYDFEAANVNGDQVISIADVTALVNIIQGKDKAN